MLSDVLTNSEKITINLAILARRDDNIDNILYLLKEGYDGALIYYAAKEAARCANILLKNGWIRI